MTLINCPCCSSNATLVEDPKRPGFGRVQCVLCGLRTEGGETIAVAVEAWNRRPSIEETLRAIASAPWHSKTDGGRQAWDLQEMARRTLGMETPDA